jgi:hypothetical protein
VRYWCIFLYELAFSDSHKPGEAKRGDSMSGYRIHAQALDQRSASSRFLLAISVFDSNGQGIANLKEGNVSVYNLTGNQQFSITELQAVGMQGFYRLLLKAESEPFAEDCILALLVKGQSQPVGRMPSNPESGHAMLKIKGG